MQGWSIIARAKHAIKQTVNKSIGPFGIELVSKHVHDWSEVANFIPFEATIAGASAAGLSVGDYIDAVMNKIPGATQETINRIAALGVFSERPKTVVEIGPGSGRYLDATLKFCSPSRYEIYETSPPWAKYVAEKYEVVLQPTDGRSLRGTMSASVELIQAHKVFSTIPFIATTRYWTEMVRVTRPGGYAAFDIVTEVCLEPRALEDWAASDIDNGSYPAVMPRNAAVGYFEKRGFSLVGSFLTSMPPGKTETFVFRKSPVAGSMIG
jgi:hypothetical protein